VFINLKQIYVFWGMIKYIFDLFLQNSKLIWKKNCVDGKVFCFFKKNKNLIIQRMLPLFVSTIKHGYTEG
jgi:hypothetical protein